GCGGSVLLEPHGGDLRIASDLEANGGSAESPGAGGNITGSPGPENATAATDVSGRLVANGGSASKGSAGDGAVGGLIKLFTHSRNGNLTVEPGGQGQVDGGGSGGRGAAGGGGGGDLVAPPGSAPLPGNGVRPGGGAAAPPR